MADDSSSKISEIDKWISYINQKIDIIEAIIGGEELKKREEEIREVKRFIDGDPGLNVPPLYEIIGQLNTAVSKLKSYQEKDQEYHHDMKMIIAGLVLMHVITLILAVIGVLT